MGSRSNRSRLEFWLAVAAVVVASGAAVAWPLRIWCVIAALVLFACLVALRLSAARPARAGGDSAAAKAARIRAQRRGRL